MCDCQSKLATSYHGKMHGLQEIYSKRLRIFRIRRLGHVVFITNQQYHKNNSYMMLVFYSEFQDSGHKYIKIHACIIVPFLIM